ncbi:MAG: hypothetical protein JRJ19_08405, partial [Deltaproteobacteria bacterium]|nr:hypothetical protein [Deltaproteobacteria bacterium]
LDATEEKSAWKLERVLSDHPGFMNSLAEFISGGHQLIVIMGNHDREFHFPAVQKVFLDALKKRTTKIGGSHGDAAVRFEPWFFQVPGEIYVEHGQQYDHYSAFRYLTSPTVEKKGKEFIALPMGNLSNRYLMSRMGFFNPYSSDYILNVFSYFFHWLKKYAFTRRNLLLNWFWGSLVVMGKLLKIKKRLLSNPPDLDAAFAQISERQALGLDTVKAIYGLQKVPITSRFYRIMREFWIDRALIALIMTGLTITLALVSIPLWIKLMVPLSSFPLLFFIYEWAVKGETIFTIEKHLPVVARRISKLLDVRVVAFGHTHEPRLLPISKNISLVNTGTWAPIMKKFDAKTLRPGMRNYLHLAFDNEQPIIRLDSWMPANLVPDRSSSEKMARE